MYQEAYEGGAMLWLPTVAMIIFMTTFAIVVVRSWLKGKQDSKHNHLASLPLEDDVPTVAEEGGSNHV